MFAAYAVAGAGIVIAPENEDSAWIFIPFAVFFASALMMMFGHGCPRCRRNFGPALAMAFRRTSMINFCPYCAFDLNTPPDA